MSVIQIYCKEAKETTATKKLVRRKIKRRKKKGIEYTYY